jgi:FMN phosphatase YigB (HAD superfamily)
MSQYGSITTITARTRLILLDCFETMVELVDGVYHPRAGIVEFLRHFGLKRGIPLVVISDATLPIVEAALDQSGLRPSIVSIYHAGNALESMSDGRVRKRLDVPMKDLGVRPQLTVFIGDSPLDAEAAKHHEVPFIRVPRSEDKSFTFKALIHGPSRYDSAEFSATFLEQYLKRKPDET